MPRPSESSRPLLMVACACLLLIPRLAAASEQALAVDLDGDGQRDRAVVDLREPTVLHVWLSASDRTQLIRARKPLLGVIATDLDGDRRPELIARDSSAQLRVWTNKRKKFHSLPPRPVRPVVQSKNPHHVQDEDPSPAEPIAGTPYVPPVLHPSALPRAPALLVAHVADRCLHCDCRSATPFSPLSPRPPPAATLI